jgi:uncharacterized membrane protein SpoIIM required for sporulation
VAAALPRGVLFSYSPTTRTVVYALALPLLLAFAGASLLTFPVDVGGVAFWVAAAGFVVVDAARNPPWRRWSAEFDQGGVRFWRGGSRGAYTYGQLSAARRDERGSSRWVTMTFADPAAPQVSVPNIRNRALGVSLDEFLGRAAPAAMGPAGWPEHPEYDSLRGHLRRMVSSEETRVVMVMLLAEFAATAAISSLPYLAGEESFFSSILSQTDASLKGASYPQLFSQIFFNNFRIALFNMIPAYGGLPLVTSTYNTSRVVEAIAVSQGYSPWVVVVNLVTLPHSWLELTAYPLAVMEGFYLLALARAAPPAGRGRAPRVVKQALVSVGAVGGLLLLADAFEVGEIALGSFALVAWAPFVAVAYAGVRLRRSLAGRGDPGANPLTP